MLLVVITIAIISTIEDAHFMYHTNGCWNLNGVEVLETFSYSSNSTISTFSVEILLSATKKESKEITFQVTNQGLM